MTSRNLSRGDAEPQEEEEEEKKVKAKVEVEEKTTTKWLLPNSSHFPLQTRHSLRVTCHMSHVTSSPPSAESAKYTSPGIRPGVMANPTNIQSPEGAEYLVMKNVNKIIVFESKKIRRIWHNEEWFFSVVDVVAALTNSLDPGAYWRKLKQRLLIEGSEVVTFCHGLKLEARDGKKYITDCAGTKAMFRIIQSIPSPKAEPFKQWLAQVGYERVQEIENPELAQERMKELFTLKGYPKDWIDKRLRGIAIRQNLTDEWKTRGIQSEKDYAILTAEISKATFGLTPSEYKSMKGLTKKTQNLRDHMTDLELIFTMLGERVTTEISQLEKPETFAKSKKVAKRGGNVAGTARKQTEKELGRSVVSRKNYLTQEEQKHISNSSNEKT